MTALRVLPSLVLYGIIDLYGVSEISLCHQEKEEEEDSWEISAMALAREANVWLDASQPKISPETLSTKQTTLLTDCIYSVDSPYSLGPNFVWLIEDKSKIAVNSLPLRLDSNFLTFQFEIKTKSWTIQEHYKVKNGSPQSVTVAKWFSNQSLSITKDNIWERRSNLGGATLTNVMLPWTTWNIIRGDHEPLDGLMPGMLSALANSLNFSMQWRRPADGVFGTEDDQGHWNGIIGELANGSADVSSAGVAITEHRKKAIDFSIIVVEDTFQLYHSSSQEQAPSLNVLAFINIFNALVWVAALAAVLIIVVLAFSSEKKLDGEEDAFGPHLLGIWFPTKTSTNPEDVRGHSRRILFFCGGALTYFLTTAYGVDLIVHMTAGKSSTISDCSSLERNEAKMYTMGGTVVSDLLSDGILRDCKAIASFLEPDCGLDCTLEILDGEKSSNSYFYAPEILDPRLSSVPGFPSPVTPAAFALGKDSELTSLFDHHLLRLIQGRISQSLTLSWR